MSYKAIVNARIVTPDGVVHGSILYTEDGKIAEIRADEEDGKLQSGWKPGMGENPKRGQKHEEDGKVQSVQMLEAVGKQNLSRLDGGLLEEYEISEMIDAEGAYAVPGGIDAHVHLGGFGEIPIADDFYQGSLGALAGGTTTVIDFCEPVKGESARRCIEKRKKEAERSAVDYAFHFVLTRDYLTQIEELPYIESEGIRNFKLFTVYDNTDLSLEEIRELIRKLGKKENNYTFLIHAEDKEVLARAAKEITTNRAEKKAAAEIKEAASADMTANAGAEAAEAAEADMRLLSEGKTPETENSADMRLLAETRPSEAEFLVAAELEKLARETGADICIAHTSAKETAALKSNLPASSLILESCPHYLEFTKDKLSGSEGALYTMTPPLRSADDNEALWEAVLSGKIHIFSTDHCPYFRKDKLGKTYNTVPCGVDGIQIRMIYLFSEGVIKRGLSIQDYVKLTSQNAAKFYHLFPQKGCLAPGSDADIVLISDKEATIITIEEMKSNIDYTIYQGRKFQGKIKRVVKSGRTVYDGMEVNVPEKTGRYLFCK